VNKRIKRFIKEHKSQLIFAGVGFVGGALFMRSHMSNSHIPAKEVNEFLARVFQEAGGNFAKQGGGYIFPQFVKQ